MLVAANWTRLAPLSIDPFAKEGWVEHVSHGVVALAALGWSAVARRNPFAVPVAVFLVILLGEEVDYGALFGWWGEADGGPRNLHTAASGAGYLLFAGLVAAFFWCGLVTKAWFQRLGSAAPTRWDAVAFGVVAAGEIVVPLLVPARAAQVQELSELWLYLIFGWLVFRGDR